MTAISRVVIEASARGWRIHPLRVRSKMPRLKDWQFLATSDRRQIESWAHQFPGCNWGAMAGPESGFFAVDVDAPEAMMMLELEFGLVPKGLTNVTARGYQLIFEWPQNADVRPARIAPARASTFAGKIPTSSFRPVFIRAAMSTTTQTILCPFRRARHGCWT